MNGWHAALAALLFLIPRFSSAAEDLSGAARELARKTAAFSGSRGAALSYRNLSSLPDSDLALLRREFDTALQGIPAPSPSVEARITLSENASEFLIVEEIRSGEESQVWIASWNRARTAMLPLGIKLEARAVWAQEEDILDVAFPGDGLLVLSASRLTLYLRQNGQWQPQQTKALHPAKSWPRDLRGRLRVTGNRLQALLPGIECNGALESLNAIDCHESEQPWILESGSHALLAANFNAERDYFDGRIVLQNGSRKSVAPFYSAAAVENSSGVAWLLALTDGSTGIFNGSFEAVGKIASWGSDIVGTDARCGGGSQVLASRPVDGGDPDALQAFSIEGGAALPLSAPLAFPGPITALWPVSGASAMAVVHDTQAAKYEAYVVTVACGS